MNMLNPATISLEEIIKNSAAAGDNYESIGAYYFEIKGK
jgi:hypothetical protein